VDLTVLDQFIDSRVTAYCDVQGAVAPWV